MTRAEFYGAKADGEFEAALAYYGKVGKMCCEHCTTCGQEDCRTAWMKTELDENGDVIDPT